MFVASGVRRLAATGRDTSRETTPLTGGTVNYTPAGAARIYSKDKTGLMCLLSCSLSGCPRAKKSGIKILHSKEDKDDQEPIK